MMDVYGLGQCCIDYLGQVPEYPPPNAKCEFTGLTIQGGGPVATALVALSRWGKRCAFTGVVGDDRLGSEIVRSLEQEGVDTTGIIVRDSAESQFAFIVAEPGGGRRTIFWQRPTGAPPSSEEIDHELLRRARVFHTDGLFPEVSLAAATAAKGAGVQVVVDAGTLRDGMLELARSSDHFIASGTFANAYAGDAAPLEACRRLAELGPTLVGVTLGEHGYAAIAAGREIQGLAHPAQAVDTTGCGDVFHAGYIYGLLEGWEVERRFRFAAWAAACVAECLGGRTGIPMASEWSHR
jgi:ribokinase